MSLPDLNQASFGAHISIPLGIFIGLLASFIQSLGLTMQRKSHVLNQNLPEHYQRVEHRRPLWLLGFSIFLSSNLIGSLVQIASLPVVILAPLGAVSLLWNAFFSHFILGDVFSIWMVLGTVLIAGGAVLIAIFGIVPEPTHSLDDLLRLFRRPAFIIYFSLLGLFVLSCLTLTHFGEFTWSRLVSKVLSPEPLPNGTDVCTLALDNGGTGDVIVTETTALLNGSKDRERSSTSSLDIYSPLHTNRRPLMLAISYASCSGIISGMCLIFAKSGVELLLLTLAGQNQFSRWESWVLGSGLVSLALLQLWYLHKALKLANPTLVCPSAFCFYNLSSIVNGLVYFNQLQLIKPLHLWLVALGIVILLAGVWVVSIQSGGGAVDVGTWNDEESDAEVIDECEEIESDMDTREHQRPSQNVAPTLFGPVPLVFETRSESHLQHRSATTEVSSNTGKGAKHLSGGHRPSSYITQPTLQRSTVATESLRFGRLQHQRTASYPSNSFSSPIDTIPTFGTGLQIGLSPISPGFMIVPRERKQRHSVLGYGGGEDQIDEGEMGDRRRRLSEGDIRTTVPQIDDIGGLAGPSTAAERDTRESQVNGGQRRSRIQWKWPRHIFARRK